MRTVYVESIFECPAKEVWSSALKPTTLTHIAQPLVRIVFSCSALPFEWAAGESYYCRSYLFGFLPAGKRKIFIERVDSAIFELQTRESDRLFRRWDHFIAVRELEDGRCLYIDRIEIDAGFLTGWAWHWTNWFFRHRQVRLRKVFKRIDLNSF